MPIMTRMRDSMPVILFSLLIAFLLLIVLEWGMDLQGMRGGGRSEVLGKVSGKKITYKEFEEVLKNVTENQRTQTGTDMNENQLKQARDQVWQNLVTQRLIEDEIKRLGITVTDQEIVDWVHGDNPPEELRRMFIDSTGRFRKELYEQVLSNPNQYVRDPRGADPSFGTKWLADIEKNLRQRRLQEKLQSLVFASVRIGEGELRSRFADQHQQYDALYALLDPNILVNDKDVQLTDADIKSYYNENIEQYKFEALRKLKYVQFLEVASPSDSAARKEEIEDAASKARSGMDFIQLTSTYSERADSGAFFRHGELSPALEDPVFSTRVGDVVGPILDNDGYHLLKVLGERTSPKEYIRASHILLSLEGESDSNAVKAKAKQVAQMAREGKSLANLAKEYSKDPSSAQRGGDLGWFTRGRMVKLFEDAAFKAKIGEIVGPVRTQYGYHIIKVTARDSRELKISNIRIPVVPGARTKNDVSERAKDFAYNAQQSEFVKEAQGLGLDVKETQVQEKGGIVPGLGVNESITRWAFKSTVGTVGEPFSIPNGYAVFLLSEAKDAGVKGLDEVKESIRPLAVRKKKMETIKEIALALKAKLAPADSLTRLTDFNPAVKAQRTGTFTLAGTVPGVGRDPNFLGAVSGLALGQISTPVQAFRGVYLIQLLYRSAFDSAAYATQRETMGTQMLQEKRNRFLTDWLAKLKESASIEDNRELFYR